ncbi:putative GPI-anchored protein pfl2 [Pecten maximus]|uniref:putative GPI-anchored protein pfl2 n=1 Tax=Pecten maximus TaxID=6579 RepID=UPI001458ACA7|nr:putative GPI-anchored protein pfl2 [Pecten maximus]
MLLRILLLCLPIHLVTAEDSTTVFDTESSTDTYTLLKKVSVGITNDMFIIFRVKTCKRVVIGLMTSADDNFKQPEMNYVVLNQYLSRIVITNISRSVLDLESEILNCEEYKGFRIQWNVTGISVFKLQGDGDLDIIDKWHNDYFPALSDTGYIGLLSYSKASWKILKGAEVATDTDTTSKTTTASTATTTPTTASNTAATTITTTATDSKTATTKATTSYEAISTKAATTSTAAITSTRDDAQNTAAPNKVTTTLTAAITSTRDDAQNTAAPNKATTTLTAAITSTRDDAQNTAAPNKATTTLTAAITSTRDDAQNTAAPNKATTTLTAAITSTRDDAQNTAAPNKAATTLTAAITSTRDDAQNTAAPNKAATTLTAAITSTRDAARSTASSIKAATTSHTDTSTTGTTSTAATTTRTTLTTSPSVITSTCSCVCNNVTPTFSSACNLTDINCIVAELKVKLTVDKSALSSSIRKKISIGDDRPSAQAIGAIGTVILALSVSLIVIPDALKLVTYVYKSKRTHATYLSKKTRI